MVGIVEWLLVVAFVIMYVFYPKKSEVSLYEARRQVKNDSLNLNSLRLLTRDIVIGLHLVMATLLAVFMSAALVNDIGIVGGILISAWVVLLATVLRHMKFVQQMTQKMYSRKEKGILKYIYSRQSIFKWFLAWRPNLDSARVHSKDELLEHVKKSVGVLDEKEALLIENSVGFNEKKISDQMLPYEKVISIKRSEILGPLVLDDLYKTGYRHFPVVSGDDKTKVVGMLHLDDISTLDTKRKHTASAETAMDKNIAFIDENESLLAALNAIIDSGQHTLIVLSSWHQPVGLLTLQNITQALFGDSIKEHR